ncbi:hypothetical protein Trichorick_01240 [Candidatus Trichorickettsia mobilis]|uniref:Rod shape-determining protein MreD n=2 Tax=Candidatus Trichorickettsia mobilis TaxID=1346319 RepID=A0ABZ0UVX2_9RICK|nr:hypothetical protein Trichorick_01240 [Candidatus Trichorickettsia mobilis]
MYSMFKKLFNIFIILCFIISLFLLLLLPLVLYRLGIESEIFPALEIIIIYYFSLNYQIKYWQIFIIGIFLDQLYHFPIGTSAVTFLLTNLLLNKLRIWLVIRTSTINFIVFCSYAFLALVIRYLIFTSKISSSLNLVTILFQYLTTIFSYPLFMILFDKSLLYLKKYAK